MASFSYAPLESATHVRLLELLPQGNSVLRCKLFHYSLHNLPKFEAVSYTWGDPTLNDTIHCEGNMLAITASCAKMLKRLKNPPKGRLLWIDQICINQKDISERNHQVTLMTDIYSRAYRVVVWLGESTAQSQYCLELVDNFDTEKAVMTTARQRIHRQELEDPTGFDMAALIPNHEEIIPWLDQKGPARKALEDLLHRPWFTRVWILQEVSVACDVLLICGETTISFQKLIEVLAYLQGITEDDMETPWNEAYVLNIFRRDYSSNGSLGLMFTFIRTNNHHATDKRDKVFALRGICAELRDQTPLPDYEKPEHEVFIDTAKAFIVADGGRLSMFNYGVRLRNLPDLPSWCPDFGGPIGRVGLPGHSTDLIKKSKTKHLPVVDGSRLLLKGKIVDTIANLSAKAEWQWQEDGPRLVKEYHTWKQWLELARTTESSYGKESIDWVFWRTLFVDSEDWLTPKSAKINDEAAAYVNYVKGLDEWFKTTDPTGPRHGDSVPDFALVRKTVGHARKYSRGKRVCVTGKNLFGMVLAHAEIGDLVVYLANASMPQLLRQVGKDTYRLVGPCYIHGLMNGEKYPSTRFGLSKIIII